jgi:hypothetical protein
MAEMVNLLVRYYSLCPEGSQGEVCKASRDGYRIARAAGFKVWIHHKLIEHSKKVPVVAFCAEQRGRR